MKSIKNDFGFIIYYAPNMRFAYLLLLFFIFFSPGLICSENINLFALLKQALANNPRVKAALKKWQADRQKVRIKKSLPDPQVKVGHYVEAVETRVGPQKKQYGFSQAFPFPGTLSLAAGVQAEKAAAKKLEYYSALNDVIRDVKIVYAEIYYIEKAIEASERNFAIMQNLWQEGGIEYSQNKMDLQTYQKSLVEKAQLEFDILQLQDLKKVYLARLQALCSLENVPVLGEVILPATEPLPMLKKLLAYAMEERLEIRQAEKSKAAMGKASRLAKKKVLPKFNFFVNYIETGESVMGGRDSGRDPLIVGLGMNLPLYAGKNRAIRRSANLEFDAAKAMLKNVQNKSESMIVATYYRTRQSARLYRLYKETLLPQANKAVEMAELMARGGELPLASLTDAQINRHNFLLAFYRAETDHFQNLARLQHLVGGDFIPAGKKTENKAKGGKK
ncbi:TolC family protein [Candidatus Riflebacteria bacterium]